VTPIIKVENYLGKINEVDLNQRQADCYLTEDEDQISQNDAIRVMHRSSYLVSHIMQDNSARTMALGLTLNWSSKVRLSVPKLEPLMI
jgi:hypothetical protein